MKKIFLFIFILFFSLWAVYFYFGKAPIRELVSHKFEIKLTDNSNEGVATAAKRPVMRVGLVADSHNDNELLKKALLQIKGVGVNFVIGLGDWSDIGTGEELLAAKKVFDDSKLKTYIFPGDHDLWESRNRGEEALLNYGVIFGKVPQTFEQNNVQFVIVDNSDIYLGISQKDWEMLNSKLQAPNSKLTFVFAHKTPFHPDSSHVMGEDSMQVAKQANQLIKLIEEKKVDGFFSGDLHFFAKFKSPSGSVRITTIGAIDSNRNFQGPRFGVLTVFDDYSWEVEDVEIR